MAVTNNISGNTPSGYRVSATDQNYLTSGAVITNYAQAKIDIDPTVFKRYGTQELGLQSILSEIGQTKAVDSTKFGHFEEDFLRDVIKVKAGYTSGGASCVDMEIADAYDVSIPNGSQSFWPVAGLAATTSNIRQYDIIEGGGVEMWVTLVNYSTGVITVECTQTGDTVPAGLESEELIITGNMWPEGSDQPDGRETSLIEYENFIQIVKDSYKVTGSSMGQKSWVSMDGRDYWYLTGIFNTRKNFQDMGDMQLLGGEKISSTSSTFAKTGKAEGLIQSILNGGLDNGYSLGALSLQNFADIADALSQYRGAEENMLVSGQRFRRDASDLLRTSPGLVDGGVVYSALGGEGRYVDLGFESFTYSGYTFHMKTLQAFNDIKGYGNAYSRYLNYAIGIPMGTSTAFDYGKEKIDAPALSLVYQDVEGEDMGYYEWLTGGAGGAKTNEYDSMKVNMRKRVSLEPWGLNRFFVFSA
jgi:hypothetical protein